MDTAPGTTLNRMIANSDVLISIGVICVVMMMIIPIPKEVLDIFLTFNIGFALVILLVSMFIQDALEFSVFPSLLLITTILRLSMNVSATRLILGEADAGEVIHAFGTFVVKGDIVVGFVIFLILVVIQFIVITKGAERVSEVAARFTLDAMPGKQMAIDADLNAGMIDEGEARRRRREIQREADFYGAMDGASKFVKGDAIAGIVIILINIIGGLIIGVVEKGFTLSEAAQRYTVLTVGDGLVTQIPALLISTGVGIVVTRSASELNLGQEITRQVLAQPRILAIAATVLIMFGLIGLPKMPMFIMAGLLMSLALIYRRGTAVTEETSPEEAQQEVAEIRRPENVMELLHIEKMELEIGYTLIPLVDADQGGDLLDRIIMIRRQSAVELGFIVPPIRIRDNMQLKPNQYAIKIKGLEIARGELAVDSYLVIGPGIEDDRELHGIDTVEPAFKLPAKWVDVQGREIAEAKGYTVVDPPSVIATHLTQIIKERAHELLGRQEVQSMIDYIKEQNPAVVQELIPDLASIGDIQRVLCNLLQERIPIRDLATILEAMADYARLTRDPDILTEYVRQALKRHITKKYADEDGRISVVTMDPSLEEYLRESLQPSDFGSYLVVDPARAQNMVQQINRHLEDMAAQGRNIAILCAPILRIYLRKLLDKFIPGIVVISYNEIEASVELDIVGMISA
ncbi:MAG: flagellar biosynthesis protein FlhA [Syntrophomonadaceae bacterium]|jgi:flagellar biosynthesis protein FlhA|nr:flagellar biosynthesis protein FlhA [Syntrophomonadaceae bacterium]